jgi:hypothetical protein
LNVRVNDSRKSCATKNESYSICQDIIDEGIRTGKLDDFSKITEEVVDNQFCAER